MTLSTTIDARGVLVVCEIGANHQGRVSGAVDLIDRCHWAGAPAVKGQKRSIPDWEDEWRGVPYDGPHSFAPDTDRSYKAHREALELSIADHEGLASYARGLGMLYGCSAWDSASAQQIKAAAFDFIKVPSALATDLALLHEIAAFGMPVICSFGMCSAEDVRAATDALEGAEVYGLQCVSSYPAKHEDVHLRVIPAMHAEYVTGRRWRAVGLSDHTSGISISAAAVALGARVIERHVTTDRSARGTDHAASLEPDGLRRVVRDCSAVLAAMGDGTKRALPVEEAAMKKLRPRRLWRP